MAQPLDSDVPPLRPRRREIRWVRRVLLLAIVVLLVDALFGDRGLRETLLARERYDDAVRELDTIRRENAALKAQIRRLTGDPATIEAEARRELGLVKRGEMLFVVRTR